MSPPPHLPGSYLVVELTNRCSLACVHCSVSQGRAHPHHSTSGYLDPKLALGLVDDLVAVGARFDALILFWLGEPLLHPYFGLIWRHALRAAVNHGTFAKVEVHTNATHLSPDRIRLALNDADVAQPWHFSLDAIDRQTYREIKGMDRFDRVQANVSAFLRHKAETGAAWPRPIFQFIVGSNNVGEAGRFREHWEAACRRLGLPVRSVAGQVPPGQDPVVFFRQLDCPTVDQQQAQNEVFVNEMRSQGLPLPNQPAAAAIEPGRLGRLRRPRQPTACSGFWKTPVIGWQGDVTTCTRDNLFRNRIGTLQNQPFSALWWGRAIAEHRAAVSAGSYQGLPQCQTCFIPKSLNYSQLSSAEIAVQAAWDADHVPPPASVQAAR